MTKARLALLLLTLVYVLALDRFHLWDLITGALLSGSLILLFRRFLFEPRPRPILDFGRRALAFIPFTGAVIGEVVVGTGQMMLVSLRVRPLLRAGIVTIPVEDRTPAGVAVTALVMSLSPGSVFLTVDWQQRVMLFHFLNATDPDGLRAKYRNFYRRYQRPVFP